jgi:hypothetical protein
MPYADHDKQIRYLRDRRRKIKQQNDADRLAVGLKPHGQTKLRPKQPRIIINEKPLAPPIDFGYSSLSGRNLLPDNDPQKEGRRLLNELRPPRTAKNSIEKLKPEPPKPKQPAFIFV